MKWKLQSHRHVHYLVVCIGRLEGADITKRPSACHHALLAPVQTVRNAAELTPAQLFHSANGNHVILKCQPMFVYLLTPCMALLELLSCSSSSSMCIPVTQPPCLCQQCWSLLVVRSIYPVCVETRRRKWHIWSMWQLVHQIFCKPGKTKTEFFSHKGRKTRSKYRKRKGQCAESLNMSWLLVLLLWHAMWGGGKKD